MKMGEILELLVSRPDAHEVLTRTNSVMTEQLSRRPVRWKYNTGEDAGYLQLDEKTPEALLQLDTEYMF